MTGFFWRIFLEEGPPATTPDPGFLEDDPPVTAPDRVLRPVSYFLTKVGTIVPTFVWVSSVATEEVLQVDSKWPSLPIYPTYDQYVHRLMVMSERETFQVLTRSAMKEFLHDDKFMVLDDKQ